MRPTSGRVTDTRALRRRWTAWTALAGLLLAGCATEGLPQSALDPAGPVARQQDRLWDLVFWIAVAVFVLVQGLILFAVFKYRDRGGDDIPKQVAGNTRLLEPHHHAERRVPQRRIRAGIDRPA